MLVVNVEVVESHDNAAGYLQGDRLLREHRTVRGAC